RPAPFFLLLPSVMDQDAGAPAGRSVGYALALLKSIARNTGAYSSVTNDGRLVANAPNGSTSPE
ncbi:hypothetical protein, partial [Thiohalocapsa sp. ML1]|uniref:hypothetical protein n=1 Tax=Thiohalocapsa sp. ML1 TaxID=1431688 RepID=UPI001C1FD614